MDSIEDVLITEILGDVINFVELKPLKMANSRTVLMTLLKTSNLFAIFQEVNGYSITSPSGRKDSRR